MNTPLHRRKLLVRSRAMRTRARQLRQRAMRLQQEATATWTHAQLQALMSRMPGATPMTCEITMMILAQRGLLEGKPNPKRLMRRWST
jgi:hypothetical protein